MKILVIGDTHCGHLGGLTHPMYMAPVIEAAGERKNIAEAQRFMWDWYQREVVDRGPYDVVILGGDLTDGKQSRNSGLGLWSTSRLDQQDCAYQVLRKVVGKKTKVFGVLGTPYHSENDWETDVMEKLGAEFSNHAFIKINGLLYDVKHKVSAGSAPATRPAVRNEWLHSLIRSAHNEGEPSDIIIRHHAHTYWHEGDGSYLGLVVPGLQWFSDYGELNFSRWVGVGCVVLETDSRRKGEWPSWKPLLAQIRQPTIQRA